MDGGYCSRNALGRWRSMNLRTVLLTRMPLAADRTSFTLSTLQDRVGALVQDLCSDIPSLKQLTSSRLVTRQEIRDSGLWLAAYLEEIPQLHLPLKGFSRVNDDESDMFLQDLRRIESDQSQIRVRFAIAASPTTSPSTDPSIRHLRRRLYNARSSNALLAPTGLVPEHIEVGGSAAVLPTGAPATVSGQIKWLSPSRAELLIVTASKSDGSEFAELRRGVRIALHRHSIHRGAASGTRLQVAMDNHHVVSLSVKVAFRWVDGAPAYLELEEFLA